MKILLIILAFAGRTDGGVATTTAGFNTMANCEKAAKEIRLEDKSGSKVRAYCVQR